MRGIVSRLAKLENVMQQKRSGQPDAAFERMRAAWRAAGGPISFVCGESEADACNREAMLRELGLIQPADKVVRMPLQPGSSRPFLRHCVLLDWGPEKREAIKAALAAPGVPYSREWYTQPSPGSSA